MRQIILDTETTGLEPSEGHRIIEIGCVEIFNRRPTGNNFHKYLQPDREIDNDAIEVHGLTNEFLADKPRFRDVADDFVSYLRGAELIIHNAAFDVGFIDHELAMLGAEAGAVNEICTVLDTLIMARKKHPGQRNSLDALCKRYGIENSHRELHGALLDAEILLDVYLAMTGGQTDLTLAGTGDEGDKIAGAAVQRLQVDRGSLKVIKASDQELRDHEELLRVVDKASGGHCIWLSAD